LDISKELGRGKGTISHVINPLELEQKPGENEVKINEFILDFRIRMKYKRGYPYFCTIIRSRAKKILKFKKKLEYLP